MQTGKAGRQKFLKSLTREEGGGTLGKEREMKDRWGEKNEKNFSRGKVNRKFHEKRIGLSALSCRDPYGEARTGFQVVCHGDFTVHQIEEKSKIRVGKNGSNEREEPKIPVWWHVRREKGRIGLEGAAGRLGKWGGGVWGKTVRCTPECDSQHKKENKQQERQKGAKGNQGRWGGNLEGNTGRRNDTLWGISLMERLGIKT